MFSRAQVPTMWNQLKSQFTEGALYLWPLIFLMMALYYIPPVPIHWYWDTFTYMDAAVEGQYFVSLGFGRSLFCALGSLLNYFVGPTSPTTIFNLFNTWVLVTLGAHFLVLISLTFLLRHRFGVLFAHLAISCFVSCPEIAMLNFGIWPENWAFIFLGLSLIFLLLPGRVTISWVLVSLVFAVLMTLMKEVSVMFIPFLTMVLYLRLSGRNIWPGRVLTAVIWGLVSGGGALFVMYITPVFLEGLSEARAELMKNHFGQSNTGISYLFINLNIILKMMFQNVVLILLLVASTGMIVWRLTRRSKNKMLLLLMAPVAALFVPMFLVAATGRTEMLGRYFSNLIPGVVLCCAIGFRRPLPEWMRSRQAIIGVFVGVALFVGGDWKEYLHHSKAGYKDAIRYNSMLEVYGHGTAVLAGADCWPVLYLQKHTKENEQGNWMIAWTRYDYTSAWRPDDWWVNQARTQKRPIAVSPTIETNIQMPLMEYLETELSDWKFEYHQSGWWIGTLKNQDTDQ